MVPKSGIILSYIGKSMKAFIDIYGKIAVKLITLQNRKQNLRTFFI